jgi:hypothetical protein
MLCSILKTTSFFFERIRVPFIHTAGIQDTYAYNRRDQNVDPQKCKKDLETKKSTLKPLKVPASEPPSAVLLRRRRRVRQRRGRKPTARARCGSIAAHSFLTSKVGRQRRHLCRWGSSVGALPQALHRAPDPELAIDDIEEKNQIRRPRTKQTRAGLAVLRSSAGNAGLNQLMYNLPSFTAAPEHAPPQRRSWRTKFRDEDATAAALYSTGRGSSQISRRPRNRSARR